MEQSNILKIKDTVDNVNLEQVLDVASCVVSVVPIPGLPMVVKVITVLIKLKPAASTVLGAAAGYAGKSNSDEMPMSKEEIAEELEEMVNLALEDGTLTNEEEVELMQAAEGFGIDPDEFIQVVRDKCAELNEW